MTAKAMKLLIDSDVISALSSPERPEFQTVQAFFNSFGGKAKIWLSMITVMEIQYNISDIAGQPEKSRLCANLEVFKHKFDITNISFESAEIYGDLKYNFKQRTGISSKALKRHNIDIALASVAIANDMTLVSQDKIYRDHLQHLDARLKHLYWKTE